jgi:hypothetical protein
VYVSLPTAANLIVIIAVACGANTGAMTGAEVPHGSQFAVQFILIPRPHLLDFQSESFSRQFLVVLVLNIPVTCPDCRLPTTKISAFGITKVSGPNLCWVRHDVSQGCLSLVQYLAVWCGYFQIVAYSRVVVIILVCVALFWSVEECFSSAVYVGLCKHSLLSALYSFSTTGHYAYDGLCHAVIATCLSMIAAAQLATMPAYERWTYSVQMFHA